METLHVIKIGGNVIDEPVVLDRFLKDFAAIRSPKILVHGGGKLTTDLANTLGIKQTMVDGRRLTDEKTLNVAVMVYAGLINKVIVAKLQGLHCHAMGLCGADGNLIKSRKRQHPTIDFGHVGDVAAERVDGDQFAEFLNGGIVPVVSPITHDGEGALLNTNADSVAQVIALAMKGRFEVKLTYCFEKKGVLQSKDNDDSFIPVLTKQSYDRMKFAGTISNGMIPKLDNAFDAMLNGINQLAICHANSIDRLEDDFIGTRLALV